jgi:hypothetical protein
LFSSVVKRMSDLIAAIKTDLEADGNSLVREFLILPNQSAILNSSEIRFVYFESAIVALRTPTFAHPSKQPLLDSLNTILGIPEQTLVWTLLNKGAHEEPNRDDFDLQHVETVLRVLEAIDRLELRPER